MPDRQMKMADVVILLSVIVGRFDVAASNRKPGGIPAYGPQSRSGQIPPQWPSNVPIWGRYLISLHAVGADHLEYGATQLHGRAWPRLGGECPALRMIGQ